MFILPENTVQLLEYHPEVKVLPKTIENANKISKELREYKNYIEEKVKNGEISIFSLDKFPTNKNTYNFTPKDVYNALVEYSENTKGLETVLKSKGIRRDSFYSLCQVYSEIREIYEKSFYNKAGCYEDLAIDQITCDIPEEFWEDTKYGRKLSYSGVRLLEHRFNGAMRLAAIHNREIYGDRTQIDQRSLNVNLNASINTQSNNTANIDSDLIQTLFTAYKK